MTTQEASVTAPEPKAPKVEQNGIVKPTDGTSTAKVWSIADALSAKAGKPAKRKEVLEGAVAAGINVATAATQYGRWSKFHGVVHVAEPKPVKEKAPKKEKAAKAPKAAKTEAAPDVQVEASA